MALQFNTNLTKQLHIICRTTVLSDECTKQAFVFSSVCLLDNCYGIVAGCANAVPLASVVYVFLGYDFLRFLR
jgi:hypothetical protein